MFGWTLVPQPNPTDGPAPELSRSCRHSSKMEQQHRMTPSVHGDNTCYDSDPERGKLPIRYKRTRSAQRGIRRNRIIIFCPYRCTSTRDPFFLSLSFRRRPPPFSRNSDIPSHRESYNVPIKKIPWEWNAQPRQLIQTQTRSSIMLA